MAKLVVSGKRKTAIAKAAIDNGEGNVFINSRPLSLFDELRQLEIKEPLVIAQDVLGKLDFDIYVKVSGGGQSSQIEASRLAIARAIVKFKESKELKDAYTNYDRHLLVADTRRKETYKPGISKARAKRQTSYR
ncbi:MAG: 30S ribosomal protein S9 [Candidatus Nanoarchaeia archaeon]